jgi:hypothetical protein
MRAQSIFKKAAAGLGTVALTLTLGACASTPLASQTDSGQIRTEQSAQEQATSGNVVATAPAPSNTQSGSGGTETPAIISGPAKVDNTGRVYTSSAVGSTGNASSTGLNTNVNIIPKETKSTVTYTQTEISPPPAPVVTTTVVETTPAPVIVAETTPMTSSTVETQTTTETTTTTTEAPTRRVMRKD